MGSPGFIGMDTGEVRTLAARFTSSSQEIRQLINLLTGQLDSTNWVGQDRNQFTGDWQGSYVPQLYQIAEALDQAANRANMNADEQDAASS